MASPQSDRLSARSAAIDHAALMGAIESLKRVGGLSTRDIPGAIALVDKHVCQLKQTLTTAFGLEFASGLATVASTRKANQVFETTELLEKILLCTEPYDTWRAQQVNRRFFAVIGRSRSLQHALCLRPNPDAHFITLFNERVFPTVIVGGDYEFHALSISISKEAADSPYARSGGHTYKDPARYLVHIEVDSCLIQLICGRRFRSILVCQPPVTQLHSVVDCCDLHRSSPASMLSKTGFTFGDIYDTTSKLLERHQVCPHARMDAHDIFGYVMVSPVFEGIVHLRPDDPLRVAHERVAARAEQRRSRERASHFYLQPYMHAKRSTYATRQKIPTFEEFEGQEEALSQD